MSSRNEARVETLRAIRDAKSVLLGAFSDSLTKADKVAAWKVIHSKATSLGLVPESKEFTYTRDVFWQNIKKNTLKKIDNRKKTGTGGGTDCKLTEIDNLVCEIIGRDSPQLEGPPPVSESWDDNANIVEEVVGSQQEDEPFQLPLNCELSSIEQVVTAQRITPRSSTRKSQRSFDDIEDELRLKKLRLSVDLMEREKYLKELQILQLERNLMLPSSPFTSHFPNVVSYELVEQDGQ